MCCFWHASPVGCGGGGGSVTSAHVAALPGPVHTGQPAKQRAIAPSPPGLGNASRLLALTLDEGAREATIAWRYTLPALSEEFGDMDPLPSGNVLASYWATHWSAAAPAREAQAGLVEVVPATKAAAWRLRVYGDACASTARRRALRAAAGAASVAPSSDCEDGGAYDRGWKARRIESHGDVSHRDLVS